MADLTHLIQRIYTHLKPIEDQTMHFVVVGAGGTGGYLLPNLTRQVALANEKRMSVSPNEPAHTITLIDADDVEPKNLIRQNFVEADIGKNKAEVLANRYGRSFKQPINFMAKYLSSPGELGEIVSSLTVNQGRPLVIVIDCTDNNKTRLLIHEAIKWHLGVETVSISSGNEEKAGQVICSFQNMGSKKSNFIRISGLKEVVTTLDTPMFYDIFPSSPIDKLPNELSCAEAAVSAPQNIHTNMTAANIIFGFVNKLINNEPIGELAVFFDVDTFGHKVYRHTETDLKELLSLTKDNKAMRTYTPDGNGSDTVLAPRWSEVEEMARLKKEEEAKLVQEELAAITSSQG